jgi:general stress protein YciG
MDHREFSSKGGRGRAKNLTHGEIQEIGRKGGKASGEARRSRKSTAELMNPHPQGKESSSVAAPVITPAVQRAAEAISTEFRRRIPDLPESNAQILANLIETATGHGELGELVERTVKSFQEWLELYGRRAE